MASPAIESAETTSLARLSCSLALIVTACQCSLLTVRCNVVHNPNQTATSSKQLI